MATRRRRIVVSVLAVVLALVLGVGGLFFSAFAGNAPIRDGAGPTPGVQTVGLGFVSVFVIDVDPASVVLIDTGAEASGVRLLAALHARGFGPDAVRAIFLTHGHSDHTAAVHAFPHADVYAMAAEVPLIAGLVGSHSPMGRIAGAHPTGIHVGHPLADGESVNIGTLTVRAFAVPGHTSGSAAYLVRNTLFLGDEASSGKDGTVRGPAWVFSEDTTLGRASLQALAARLQREGEPVNALAFAHSGPIVGDALTHLAQVH